MKKISRKNKIILAIETSCDDTSIALIKCFGSLKDSGAGLKFEIMENIISSQISVHRPFGGVVPNLAKREHIKNLPKIFNGIMNQELEIKGKKSIIHNSKFIIPAIDTIAVTVGPGLEPALWTGINFAKELSEKLNKPLIGVNHIEAHLYSNWLPQSYEAKPRKIGFPAVALIVSGGHTILLKMDGIAKWKKLGETLDDAAGEAFDKVARMLELPYPGGPEIQKLAIYGSPTSIDFPRPMLNQKNYNFSFSGLKTSVLYYLRDHQNIKKEDVAASFQQAVIDVLVKKTIRAAQEFRAKSVLLCGGVSVNKSLRETLAAEVVKLNGRAFHAPDFEFSIDNAAMIAAAAYINLLDKKRRLLKLEAQGNLSI
jgi:N6-L-threonylcarbamoyladenine synthase